MKIAESVIYLEQGDILRHRSAGGEAPEAPHRDTAAPAVNPIA